MTHLKDEEETRHVFGLPDSAIAITGVEEIAMISSTGGTW